MERFRKFGRKVFERKVTIEKEIVAYGSIFRCVRGNLWQFPLISTPHGDFAVDIEGILVDSSVISGEDLHKMESIAKRLGCKVY